MSNETCNLDIWPWLPLVVPSVLVYSSDPEQVWQQVVLSVSGWVISSCPPSFGPWWLHSEKCVPCFPLLVVSPIMLLGESLGWLLNDISFWSMSRVDWPLLLPLLHTDSVTLPWVLPWVSTIGTGEESHPLLGMVLSAGDWKGLPCNTVMLLLYQPNLCVKLSTYKVAGIATHPDLYNFTTGRCKYRHLLLERFY